MEESNLNQEKIRDKEGKFKKGHSGNPTGKGAGRPKGSFSLKTLLVKELQKLSKIRKYTHARLLIMRMIKKAIEDGDFLTIKLIMNYVDGMPRQYHELKAEIKTELEILNNEELDARIKELENRISRAQRGKGEEGRKGKNKGGSDIPPNRDSGISTIWPTPPTTGSIS